MVFLKLIFLLFASWASHFIVAVLLGIVFNVGENKFRGFIAGLLLPNLTAFIITYFFVDKNETNTFDITPLMFILMPIFLIYIKGIYTSGLQDGSGNSTLPVTGIQMKLNKFLLYGVLIGCFLAFFLFTEYRF